MATLLRCDRASLEHLTRKWQFLAHEIERAALARHHDNTARLLMHIVEASKKKIGVGNVRLRPDMCVLHIETPVEIEGAEIFQDAWLGFPSELEGLLYLRHLWLRRIGATVDGAAVVYRETFSLMDKAMDVCIREKGFPNDTLKAFILNGVRDFAGAEIKAMFCVRDEYSVIELYAFEIDEPFGDLRRLVDENEFAVDNEHHMMMLEQWMSTTAFPRGRAAAWGSGGDAGGEGDGN